MRKPLIYVALLAALFAVVELLGHAPLQKGGEAAPVTALLRAVDVATGDDVAGAVLTRLDESGAETGRGILPRSDGTLRLTVSTPRLVRLTADGYLPRVVAVARPDSSDVKAAMVVPLTPAAAGSVSLRFGGQVMMGRGLYAPATSTTPALLTSASDAAAHSAVLSAVTPMLGDADLSVVTLGAPLVRSPSVTGDRPSGFHPDRPVVLSSSTSVAPALAASGVDLVNLANSHVFDALQPGLDSTTAALDSAGIAHVGAGATVEEAWRPTYVQSGGQRVGFVACTAFGGGDYDIHFVAGPDQGGAARCDTASIEKYVAQAAAEADEVVFLLDAGPGVDGPARYHERAGSDAERLARTAADAGASVVVGARSHVVRGATDLDGVPWLEGTGDLVSDSRMWSSLPSSLARVVLAGGAARSISLDPLTMVRFRPVPAAGSLADATARRAAADPDGLLTLGDGDAHWPAAPTTVAGTLTGDAGTIARLQQGQWLQGTDAGVRPGHDLLWGTGSMEDLESDPSDTGSTQWALGKYVTTSMEAACSGVQGLRLRRGPLSTKDVVISPQYREPVVPGTRLTLTADVRLASEGASLEVRWYRTLDPAKRSSGSTSVAIEPHRLHGPCSPVRLDLQVPEGVVAVQPYVRLSPIHDVNLAAELRVDDVQLIAWSDLPASGRQFDTVEFTGSASVPLARDGVAGS
ncbi:MAG: CapA family protein [Nocardioidaceae bacterium]